MGCFKNLHQIPFIKPYSNINFKCTVIVAFVLCKVFFALSFQAGMGELLLIFPFLEGATLPLVRSFVRSFVRSLARSLARSFRFVPSFDWLVFGESFYD